MHCIHITNDKKEIYETAEELSSVFIRKKNKLVTWLKSQKLILGDWTDADEVIDAIEKFETGTYFYENKYLSCSIIRYDNFVMILKENKTYYSLRYYFI